MNVNWILTSANATVLLGSRPVVNNSAASVVVTLVIPEYVLILKPFAFINKKPNVSVG